MKSVDARYASGDELAQALLAVKQGVTPTRSQSFGDRTQVSMRSNGNPEEPPPQLDIPERGEKRPSFPAVSRITDKLQHSLPWRIGAGLFVVLLAAFLLREQLSQWLIFYDAARAARNRDFEASEQKLERVLARNPDFDRASRLLFDVSAELVLPTLPRELSAKHNHRLGSCSGRLTLRQDGVEYGSKSHGLWQWRFEHIREMDVRSTRGFAIQTREDDMLGLLSSKNYNFSFLSESPEEHFWKRYERLYLRSRAGEGEPRPAPAADSGE
jgi:hypothetical protein